MKENVSSREDIEKENSSEEGRSRSFGSDDTQRASSGLLRASKVKACDCDSLIARYPPRRDTQGRQPVKIFRIISEGDC
jgi:hypothetical protein